MKAESSKPVSRDESSRAWRCPNCGELAREVSRALALAEITEHNTVTAALVEADPEALYSVRNAYIEDYEYCRECSLPASQFVVHSDPIVEPQRIVREEA